MSAAATPTAGQVALDAAFVALVEFTVAKIAQPSPGADAGTVTDHSHQFHDPFDAGGVVNDPPPRRESPATRAELDGFLDLVQRHEHRVRGVVARFLDDPRDVDEALQDTFVQAWRHRADFRSEAAVFTWLYRIATNTALMRLRRHSAATVALEDLTPHQQLDLADDPLAGHADRLDRIDDVRAALADLPAHHRTVVILRDVEDHSNAEVAQLLGLPVTTVKAYLHRGRRTLRSRLQP